MGETKHHDVSIALQNFAAAGGLVALTNEVSLCHLLISLSTGASVVGSALRLTMDNADSGRAGSRKVRGRGGNSIRPGKSGNFSRLGLKRTTDTGSPMPVPYIKGAKKTARNLRLRAVLSSATG
ncbi:hypothetical protein D3C85_1504150 [compost metagenome]